MIRSLIFIYPTWMKIIQLTWNNLATNVRILATNMQLINN